MDPPRRDRCGPRQRHEAVPLTRRDEVDQVWRYVTARGSGRGLRSCIRPQLGRAVVSEGRCVGGVPERIRTSTGPDLSRVPLPVGPQGPGGAAGGSRTRTGQALDLVPLPVGLPRRGAPEWIRTITVSVLNRVPLPVGLRGHGRQLQWGGEESNLQAEATGLRPAGLTTCPTAPRAALDRGSRCA